MPAAKSRRSRQSSRTAADGDRCTHRRRLTSAARITNRRGVHLLRSKGVVDALVDSAAPRPATLVLDLGAGPGTLTGPLAATGARILAVERDPAFVAQLRRRFGERSNVRVIDANLVDMPLPRRPFQVVASIPYDLSTVLLRRLLGPARTSLSAADLVVEWGFARRITQPEPRDLEVAWWGARFEVRLARRIPRAMFAPRPAVDSAHLVVRRRPELTRRSSLAALHVLLSLAYQDRAVSLRGILAKMVPRSRARSIAQNAGLALALAADEISVAQWSALARAVAADPGVRLPPLPRRLDTACRWVPRT